MEGIIGCVPVSEEARQGIPYTPYPDSKVVKCPQCGEDVWIGPKQMQKMNEGVPMSCIMCIVKSRGPDDTFRVQMLDPNKPDPTP